MSNLSEDRRKQIIDDLVANTRCFEEGDREMLELFSDNMLLRQSGKGSMSEEDWLRDAPENVRAVLNYGHEAMAHDRQLLIDRMTLAIEDDASKTAIVNQLKDKSIDELRILAQLAPAPAPAENSQPFFIGAGPTANANQEFDSNDVLEEVEMEW